MAQLKVTNKWNPELNNQKSHNFKVCDQPKTMKIRAQVYKCVWHANEAIPFSSFIFQSQKMLQEHF